MPIPNFDLDDVSFQQLVNDAIKKIPKVSNQWTNYNLSDPGITLLELFAFLTDNQIYILNKITKNHYLKFLKLIGVRPKEAVLPRVELSLFANRLGGGVSTLDIRYSALDLPRNTRFVSKKQNIYLEIDENLNFIPSLKLSKCMTFSNNQIVENDITSTIPIGNNIFHTDSFISQNISEDSNIKNSLFIDKKYGKPFFYVFGQNPKENDMFFLNLEYNSNETNENGKEISIYVKVYDKDLPPLGIHGNEEFAEFADKDFYSLIKWEYYLDDDANKDTIKDQKSIFYTTQLDWKPLELTVDDTKSFSQSGKIRFKIFRRFGAFDKKAVMWIRATLIKNNNYFVPPRIESILCNTVSASLGITIEQSLGNRSSVLVDSKWIYENPHLVDVTVNPALLSNGLANQTFQIEDWTKLPILSVRSLRIEYVDESKGKVTEEWTQVDDFDSSLPFDRHFMLIDKKNGVLKFGDGENGKILPIGSKVILKYKTGNLKDNVTINEGNFFEIDSSDDMTDIDLPNRLPIEIFGINIHPSTVGKLDEDIKEAVIRARTELSIPFKIVSKRDCEYIAMNTPRLRVGKVKVVTNSEMSGYVTVLDAGRNNLDVSYIVEPENLENTLFVAAIPYSFSTKPMLNLQFLNSILRHLDKHRLITTKIRMVIPESVEISVTAHIRLKNQLMDNEKVRQKIYDTLEHIFRPLPNSFENREFEGWDFGKDVYRSEIISNIENIEEIDSVLNIDLSASGSYGSFKMVEEGNIIINNLNLVVLKDIDISFV